MALYLHDRVVAGELDNTRKGSVTGWLELTDRPDRVTLDLEGNCWPDLAGWRFRIVRLRPPMAGTEEPGGSEIAAHQAGKVGDITASQRAKETDCPPIELYRRHQLGEPPPFEWKPAIYVEWYTEVDGRVVIHDTRLGVERLGKRAFELTEVDLEREREAAAREVEAMREEGYVVESDETGFATIVRKAEPPDDFQSALDEQTRDLERAVRESLESDEEERS